MASVHKRSKKKNAPYRVQYIDAQGRRRSVTGFTDKGLSEQLGLKLETEARMRRLGLIDVDAERAKESREAPIDASLTAFEESLADNSGKHVTLTMSRVRRIVEGCGFSALGDIIAEKTQVFLRSLRKSEGIGHRTYNHYLQALDSFCNWCVATKRLPSNPIVGLERLNPETDVRHKRRALTAEQVAALVQSARASGVSIQRYNGELRARNYLLSYLTGLRRNEIASLSPRSFALNAEIPTVTVQAASSKHRREDVLPLHPELVAMVREWIHGLSPSEKLFPRLARRRTWLMVKKDLERIGIPYENEEGIADFHAAGRHTHITELLRNGASLPEAQKLARHSDINQTMKYTHIGLGDQSRAVAKLPVVQIRCIPGVSGCPGLSSRGKRRVSKNDATPCGSRGSVVGCQPMASTGKVEAAGIEPAS